MAAVMGAAVRAQIVLMLLLVGQVAAVFLMCGGDNVVRPSTITSWCCCDSGLKAACALRCQLGSCRMRGVKMHGAWHA